MISCHRFTGEVFSPRSWSAWVRYCFNQNQIHWFWSHHESTDDVFGTLLSWKRYVLWWP